MENFGPLSLLITGIASLCCVAAYALGSWRAGSRSTRARKPPVSPPPTSDLESRFAKIEADQVELFSTLQKLTTSMKRLSSRAGMQDLREREAHAPPPMGTPKSELRKHYGVAGMNGPAQAALQLVKERKNEQES